MRRLALHDLHWSIMRLMGDLLIAFGAVMVCLLKPATEAWQTSSAYADEAADYAHEPE